GHFVIRGYALVARMAGNLVEHRARARVHAHAEPLGFVGQCGDARVVRALLDQNLAHARWIVRQRAFDRIDADDPCFTHTASTPFRRKGGAEANARAARARGAGDATRIRKNGRKPSPSIPLRTEGGRSSPPSVERGSRGVRGDVRRSLPPRRTGGRSAFVTHHPE